MSAPKIGESTSITYSCSMPCEQDDEHWLFEFEFYVTRSEKTVHEYKWYEKSLGGGSSRVEDVWEWYVVKTIMVDRMLQMALFNSLEWNAQEAEKSRVDSNTRTELSTGQET